LSRRTPSPTDGPHAGFTIIEVLIALAVVAISIVAIGSVMSTNVRGVKSMERHVALMQATRRAMITAIPPRAELAPGVSTGQLNDYRWQIDVGPAGEGWTVPDSDVAWIPQLVRIQVHSPGGGAVELQTVRLMHRPRQ
jgi:general secretion pathway protein I